MIKFPELFLLHLAAHLVPLLLLSFGRVRKYTPAVVHCKNTTCAHDISQKTVGAFPALLHLAAHLVPLQLLSFGRVRKYTPAVVHCKKQSAHFQLCFISRHISCLCCFSSLVVYASTLPQSFIAKTRPVRTIFRKNSRRIASLFQDCIFKYISVSKLRRAFFYNNITEYNGNKREITDLLCCRYDRVHYSCLHYWLFLICSCLFFLHLRFLFRNKMILYLIFLFCKIYLSLLFFLKLCSQYG